MGERASVDSIDALKAFKAALWKFQEAANVALADAEGEIHRTLNWVENEQPTHWQGQIRKRQELVSRCKEAVRMKKLFKDSAGRTPSAVDEEKALAIALRRLETANEKFTATKAWSRKLQRELMVYKGDVQRFATAVQSDLPNAAGHLDALVAKLDEYVAVGVTEAVSTAEGIAVTESVPSMARAEGETPPVKVGEEARVEPAVNDEIRNPKSESMTKSE